MTIKGWKGQTYQPRKWTHHTQSDYRQQAFGIITPQEEREWLK